VVSGQRLDGLDYLLVRRRLQEVAARTGAQAFAHDIFVALCSENQHFRIRGRLANLSGCLNAVDARHIDAHDDNVRLCLNCQLDRVDPVVGFAANDKISARPQQGAQTASDQNMMVSQKNTQYFYVAMKRAPVPCCQSQASRHPRLFELSTGQLCGLYGFALWTIRQRILPFFNTFAVSFTASAINVNSQWRRSINGEKSPHKRAAQS